MLVEKTLDRSCYRRCNAEKKNIEKTGRKMITIFYNEVIFVLAIILGLLILKIYSLKYFGMIEAWYANELKKGIAFEKIKENFLDIYEKKFLSDAKKDKEKINSNLLLVNDTSMVNEFEKTKSGDKIDWIKNKYELIRPVEGIISSSFGARESNSTIISENHKGIDVAAAKGTDIVAAHNGKIVYADNLDSYGICVVIENENLKTVYAHCSDVFVKRGDLVKLGEKIAEVGMTGNATGNHLHFEIKYNEEFLNPEEIIQW